MQAAALDPRASSLHQNNQACRFSSDRQHQNTSHFMPRKKFKIFFFNFHHSNIRSATSISDAPSGLVSVPMKVTDGSKSDNATVLAGLAGYKLHNDDGIFALEPVHGWCLLLPKDSSFRNDLVDWEENINGVGSEK